MRVLPLALLSMALLGAGCKSSMRPETSPVEGVVLDRNGAPSAYAWVQPNDGDGVQADVGGHYLLHVPLEVDQVTLTAIEVPKGTVIAGRWTGSVTLHVGLGAKQNIVLDRFQPI